MPVSLDTGARAGHHHGEDFFAAGQLTRGHLGQRLRLDGDQLLPTELLLHGVVPLVLVVCRVGSHHPEDLVHDQTHQRVAEQLHLQRVAEQLAIAQRVGQHIDLDDGIGTGQGADKRPGQAGGGPGGAALLVLPALVTSLLPLLSLLLISLLGGRLAV